MDLTTIQKTYEKEESSNILFKGGTALKIVYGSPRFSEDLDFSGTKLNKKQLESLQIHGTIKTNERRNFLPENFVLGR